MAAIPTIEDDPCGRLKALREIRDQLMTGQSVSEVDFEQGNGTRRRMRFSSANLDLLNREIEAASDACALSQGNHRPRRFAIGGRMS